MNNSFISFMGWWYSKPKTHEYPWTPVLLPGLSHDDSACCFRMIHLKVPPNIRYTVLVQCSSSMFRIRKRRKKRASSVTPHYQTHKKAARQLIHSRLEYWNQYYNFSYNRVAVRNQRRCWGSCSSLRNLNFSYRLLFLPPHLCDYIIVHELCHLAEMNHGPRFWALVAEVMPEHEVYQKELRQLEKSPNLLQLTYSETDEESQLLRYSGR